MKRKLQFAGLSMALGMGVALAVPCFAQGPRANWVQNRQDNKPPKQPSQQPPRQQQPSQQPPRLQQRAQVWSRLRPEQREHIRNDVLPKWQQLPQERRQAIQQRLRVLQNMPESARNQRLNDTNFTRGMSDDDRATLRDLSHVHVGGAPDPPND